MQSLRTWKLAALLALAAAALVAACDLHVPAEVAYVPVPLQGVAAARAEGLVIQQESGSEVWASRGYAIYRSREGGPFVKIAAVRPPFGEAWAGYSAFLRRRFGYQELVEVLPIRDDLLVVFAGGEIYRVDPQRGTQEAVHRLRFFGRGEGRGVMAHGLTRDAAGALYYGEYATAPGHETRSARIWRSLDEARTWQVAYEFPPGAVRHIHGVQWDPVGEALWVSTGDQDSGSRIGWSRDGGRSFRFIGEGSQDFRATSLLFLDAEVAWGMDADQGVSSVWRWQRATGELAKAVPALPGPAFYAEPLDGSLGLLGTAQHDVAAFLLGAGGGPRKLFQWTLPRPPRGGPHPALRLARGSPSGSAYVHLNPLRTREDEAAIYRIPRAALPARAGEGD